MPERNDNVKFGCFDANAETKIHERNLPHWFQPGAAMFITFRTLDSMPQEAIVRWQRELEQWLWVRNLPTAFAESSIGRRFPNHEKMLTELSPSERIEFKKRSDQIFHRTIDDCHGACHLRLNELANIVGDSLRFYDSKKYDLDCFVVMPNHVHAIVQFRRGESLKVVSQSWMRYTARLINQAIGRSGEFWQSESFDHLIRSPEQFEYLQDYIRNNPSKANLKRGDYLFWSRSEA